MAIVAKTKTGGYTWAGMKNKILGDIWSKVNSQGFSTIILIVAIAFFYHDRTIMACKIDKCNEQLLELYISDNQKVIKMIETCNAVIDRNTAQLDKL